VTKADHDVVDCLPGVDGGVRPGCYDVFDGVADYDDGDVAGWFVQIATEVV